MQDNPRFFSENMTVQLRMDSSKTATGRVLETRFQGEESADVLAGFDPEECPPIPIGKTTAVLVSSGDQREPVELHARVTYRWEDGRVRQYRFAFEQEAAQSIRVLLNRRGAIRVPPEARAPVQVRLTTEDGRILEKEARDLSGTGLSVFIDEDDDELWLGERKLSVDVLLPGQSESLRFVGAIRYRTLCGSMIQVGIQFDEDETVGFPGRQEQVLKYVMGRYAERMRKAG